MRVTKIIKEEVTRRVNKIYDAKMDALRAETDAAKTAIEEKLAAILAGAEAEALAMFEKNANGLSRESMYYHRGGKPSDFFRREATLAHRENNQTILTLQAERDNKIGDILFALEVASGKDAFNEVLQEILGDAV